MTAAPCLLALLHDCAAMAARSPPLLPQPFFSPVIGLVGSITYWPRKALCCRGCTARVPHCSCARA